MFIDFDVYSEKVAESQSVQDFLEHFGVRGMRWGVRRDPRTGIRPLAKTISESKPGQVAIKRGQTHKQSTPEKKVNSFIRKHRKAAAITAIVGTAAVAAGSIYAAKRLGEHKRLKLSQIRNKENASLAKLGQQYALRWKTADSPWMLQEPFSKAHRNPFPNPRGRRFNNRPGGPLWI